MRVRMVLALENSFASQEELHVTLIPDEEDDEQEEVKHQATTSVGRKQGGKFAVMNAKGQRVTLFQLGRPSMVGTQKHEEEKATLEALQELSANGQACSVQDLLQVVEEKVRLRRNLNRMKAVLIAGVCAL